MEGMRFDSLHNVTGTLGWRPSEVGGDDGVVLPDLEGSLERNQHPLIEGLVVYALDERVWNDFRGAWGRLVRDGEGRVRGGGGWPAGRAVVGRRSIVPTAGLWRAARAGGRVHVGSGGLGGGCGYG